jgi:hypothetical protein
MKMYTICTRICILQKYWYTLHHMTPTAELERMPNLEQLGYKEAPPPFINGLLNTNRNISITKEQFKDIVITADRFQEQLYLDAMNRQIDVTGFVSAFVGICQSPEEVQARLDEIAYKTLTNMHQEPTQLQKDVAMTLKEKDYCNIEALLWIDRQHKRVVDELKAIRAPEAEAFRQRNIDAIQNIPNKQILYVPTYWESRNVNKVTRFINAPPLPEVNRRILEHLTPVFFKRQWSLEDQDPNTLIGFMQQFRKAGDPLARSMANMLKEKLKLEEYAERISQQA